MRKRHTAVVAKDGDWWVGWIEEAPGVNGQERTRRQLLTTLRTTLREAIEINCKEASLAAAPSSAVSELPVGRRRHRCAVHFRMKAAI